MVRILIFIFFFIFIFISYSVQAQFIDLMGNLSIQGAITQQSIQSVGQGMSALQKVRVLQDVQQIATEIQTGYLGNYNNISKNRLSQDYLKQISWILEAENTGFYIQLNQIDKDLCSYLVQNRILNSQIQVNENNKKNCNELNMVRYYFE